MSSWQKLFTSLSLSLSLTHWNVFLLKPRNFLSLTHSPLDQLASSAECFGIFWLRPWVKGTTPLPIFSILGVGEHHMIIIIIILFPHDYSPSFHLIFIEILLKWIGKERLHLYYISQKQNKIDNARATHTIILGYMPAQYNLADGMNIHDGFYPSWKFEFPAVTRKQTQVATFQRTDLPTISF
jgi:hypothetical protein